MGEVVLKIYYHKHTLGEEKAMHQKHKEPGLKRMALPLPRQGCFWLQTSEWIIRSDHVLSLFIPPFLL